MSFTVPVSNPAGRYVIVFLRKGMPHASLLRGLDGNAIRVDESALTTVGDIARTVGGNAGLYDHETLALVVSVTPGPEVGV